MATHTVFNQVPPLTDYNPADYPVIGDALALAGATAALPELHAVGAVAGSAAAIELGDLAEAHPPVLRTHDRYGNRVDEVAYDPSYHQLMRHATGFGLHGSPWTDTRDHAHLIRAAKMHIWGQVDPGHLCPISMTYAVVPALRLAPELAKEYEPGLTTRDYDFGLRAPQSKRALIAGMSMTEKQGGSDVRANTTTAVQQTDGTYRITGHKWFTSAPMSDLFLTLAQTDAGVTCFLVPRVLPDGSRNAFYLQRLKDKLGNHSNASSEVEYADTVAYLVGEEGRGVPTIIEMVNMTRLDCTLATSTLMRVGVAQAAHHAAHRKAFGNYLADQPLMRNVLADLAVEAEGATLTGLWLASLVDKSDDQAQALRRVALAVSKYYVCKRGPIHAAEALECLGGNGYVEESRMPRLYREAPLLSIWEGSGNVAALDMLRALAKQPAALGVFFDEIEKAASQDPQLAASLEDLKAQFTDMESLQYRARSVVGRMAQVLQAALLVRYGNPAVAEAYVRSRLGGEHGDVFGTLPPGVDVGTIIDRATPKLGS